MARTSAARVRTRAALISGALRGNTAATGRRGSHPFMKDAWQALRGMSQAVAFPI